MCLAIPAKLIDIEDNYAIADIMGIRQKIDISLLEEPCINDMVIVHAGYAIEKIDMNYYHFLSDFYLKELKAENDR